MTYSGTISIIDPSKNLYRISLHQSDPGISFDGLAFLMDSAAGKSEDAIALFAVQKATNYLSPYVRYWIRR